MEYLQKMLNDKRGMKKKCFPFINRGLCGIFTGIS